MKYSYWFLCLVMLVGWHAATLSSATAAEALRCDAIYSKSPIHVDGQLDELVWKDSPAYRLSLPNDIKDSEVVQQPGTAQFAWDDKYFYLAIDFKDSDIVAEGQSDQLHHYLFGDVCELFLKPAGHSWYWELYVTPHGKKSHFWFPSRGRSGLPSCFEDNGSEMKVAAQCHGSLNDWADEDANWTAEMAIPIKELTARGDRFEPGAKWHLCVGRYNYSIHLPKKELSSFPKLPRTDFHSHEDYAELRLLGGTNRKAQARGTPE